MDAAAKSFCDGHSFEAEVPGWEAAIRKGCYGNREFTFNGSTTKKTMTLFFSLSLGGRAGLTLLQWGRRTLPRASAVQSKVNARVSQGQGGLTIVWASPSRPPGAAGGKAHTSSSLTSDCGKPLPRPAPRGLWTPTVLTGRVGAAPASPAPRHLHAKVCGRRQGPPPSTSMVKAGTPPRHLHGEGRDPMPLGISDGAQLGQNRSLTPSQGFS